MEIPDFPDDKNERVFSFKFRQKNFIYASLSESYASFSRFSDKADVFIVGNHERNYNYPISYILPSNLSHLIASNGDANYLHDFLDPITDKTKIHTDNSVKLDLND